MHSCPLCNAPMTSQFVASTHPAIPDRTLLHCVSSDCDLCCTTDDLPLFQATPRNGYARAWAGGMEAHALLRAETAVLG